MGDIRSLNDLAAINRMSWLGSISSSMQVEKLSRGMMQRWSPRFLTFPGPLLRLLGAEKRYFCGEDTSD
jgi:hypothetical protein